MTCYLLTCDPGTAHPAKNVAVPGLPNQPQNHSGRNPMVGKARNRIGVTAERVAGVCDDLVTYTPEDLNRLIDTVTAREVAGRLRERAEWHRAQATEAADIPLGARVVSRTPAAADRADWHRGEAEVLERLAACELARIERGERR